MYSGKLVFAQLMEYLPLHTFRRCVQRYPSNYPTKSFSHLDQFLCMAFAQLTYRESLRDIETCLRAHQTKLYHLGIRGNVAKSTLADANEQRDCRIYADFAMSLIQTARSLYASDSFAVELEQTVYALDTTTIDLCLSVFPWARFRQAKAAVKMHTLLDLRGNIPTFIHISDGKMHEVNVLDILIPEAGSFYIMDRGFTDFARWFTLHQAQAFFVIRGKSNLTFRRVYSRAVDKTTGLHCDQTIALTSVKASHDYPQHLRRIKFYDAKHKKYLIFLTNNFDLPALTIAQLYRCRWQVELFFKWIKQHLRIKKFYGTTENAVKTQIWIAISIYVLVAIVKKRLKTEASLYTILQILSLTLFEKTPLDQLLTNMETQMSEPKNDNQLNIFD
ncbi:MAG TPA: IS4 family transposase [Burkholderiales bacterium]|nr:IS4 family transposase [Burkholderiales bacterium]